jgi:hypothetical protein
MPKSQFDQELKIVGGRVRARGPVRLGPGPHGSVHVHWRIEQTGTTAEGIAQPNGGTWEGTEAQSSSWQIGPAKAVGHMVELTMDGAETFSWTQQVTLKMG